MSGLIGCKLGMSRIFTKEGISIPVTIIEVKTHYITQIKNIIHHGYSSIQVTTGKKKLNRMIKSEIGQFSKISINSGKGLWEFLVKNNNNFFVGQVITVELFSSIKKVDVTGFSKGKGFSGTIKRWNFKSQDYTHGNSLSHRAPGSIGQNQTPGKVFKGKKMSGQLGNVRITIQNLNIIRIDTEYNLLIIKGSVPGATGNNLIIKPSIKYNK